MQGTQEKALVQIRNKGIIYKIRNFFAKILKRDHNKLYQSESISNDNDLGLKSIQSKAFIENIRNTENEETILLKLQKQYRSGEIKEEELTKEQIDMLCVLYDKQIELLRRTNKIRKEKLIEYRKRMKTKKFGE